MSNDFMRATLATTNYGLATMWTLDSQWRLHGMAMGEPLGNGLLRTANNLNGLASDKSRVLAVLGDPTLRLHTLSPPANFSGLPGSGCVSFTWRPVSDVQYHIYRATTTSGPFTLFSSNATQNIQDCPYPGSVYMLRAVQVVTSGSGSYSNISQGSFWP